MKNYLAEMVDLQGDSYLNPVGAAYNDGTGTHQRPLSAIKSISIHHDAVVRTHAYDSVGRYRSEAKAHYSSLGPGLQYHYKIDNQGTIFKIRPHTTWLYVVGSSENVSTIAICLDGYFHPPHNQIPTREQYEALGQLLVKLCEQSPEFPATYPDVRPHASYTGTACAGSTFNPWVYAIQNKADVLRVPDNAVYDWPELQPQPPKPTEPPAPVDPRPEWERNFEPVDLIKWTEGTGTVIDITNNKTLTTLADNTKVELGGETMVGGTKFYISKYWVARSTFNKLIPAAQLKDTADVIPTPPVPTEPPPPAVQDNHGAENNALLKQILAIVQAILDKITGIGDKITSIFK